MHRSGTCPSYFCLQGKEWNVLAMWLIKLAATLTLSICMPHVACEHNVSVMGRKAVVPTKKGPWFGIVHAAILGQQKQTRLGKHICKISKQCVLFKVVGQGWNITQNIFKTYTNRFTKCITKHEAENSLENNTYKHALQIFVLLFVYMMFDVKTNSSQPCSRLL